MSKNDGRNGFTTYEKACEDAWIHQLSVSFEKINNEIRRTKDSNQLNRPMFCINPNITTKWGSWSPSTRVMEFSSSLLRNFEWPAVEYVMRHEMAHQIVSEVFKMDCYGVAHGEAFKLACDIVNIIPDRCASTHFLSAFKGVETAPMVSKVRKLFEHAGNGSATEAEAETFMRKAKELMLRHDLKMKDINGTDRLFVKRPFGPNLKRWQSYLWSVGSLLSEHYNVECIKTYTGYNMSRLELFGEPDNLDIAEYVGHALLNQAEIAYKKHQKEYAQERKELNERIKKGEWVNTMYMRKLSKRAFMEGLIAGYSHKLRQDREEIKKHVGVEIAKEEAKERGEKYYEGDCSMIPMYNKKLLKEMYNDAYPSIRRSSYSGSRGAGRSAGQKAGQSLSLAQGVRSNGNAGRLIGAS